MARGILVPWPRIKPTPLALEVQSLNHWTTRKVPWGWCFSIFILLGHARLYLKWITNKDLPYSTWNSAQSSAPAWIGGAWGRVNTCMCRAESLRWSPEAPIIHQLCPNTKENVWKKIKMDKIYLSFCIISFCSKVHNCVLLLLLKWKEKNTVMARG